MNFIQRYFERVDKREEKHLTESYQRMLDDPNFEPPKEGEVVFWKYKYIGKLKFTIVFQIYDAVTVNHTQMNNNGWLEYNLEQ